MTTTSPLQQSKLEPAWPDESTSLAFNNTVELFFFLPDLGWH